MSVISGNVSRLEGSGDPTAIVTPLTVRFSQENSVCIVSDNYAGSGNGDLFDQQDQIMTPSGSVDNVPPSMSPMMLRRSNSDSATLRVDKEKKILQIDLFGRLQEGGEQPTTNAESGLIDKVPPSLIPQPSFAGMSPMRSKSLMLQSSSSMRDLVAKNAAPTSADSKSRDNIMYLAKSFKPQISIAPSRSTPPSKSGVPPKSVPVSKPVTPSKPPVSPSRPLIVTPSKPAIVTPSKFPVDRPSNPATPVHSMASPIRPLSLPLKPVVQPIKPITPSRSATSSRPSSPPSSSSANKAFPFKNYSLIKYDPVKIPAPRKVVESASARVPKCNVEEYFSDVITEDTRDGKGFGRRIKLWASFDPDFFLGDKESCVQAAKRNCREEFRIAEDKTVGSLIEKFRDLAPSDYNNQIINLFGFEKIYSISDSVLHVYHPNPSPNSPFKNRGTNLEIETEVDEGSENGEGSCEKDNVRSYTVDRDLLNVSVSDLKKEHENSERDHVGPSSLRQSSVKQIAREKRFCHELFLPLLNAKLKPEVLDFIKEEVTMQLNLKICDLYDDAELSISDKETFEKALGAYLRSEKLIKQLQEARDSLLAFVKENMPN